MEAAEKDFADKANAAAKWLGDRQSDLDSIKSKPAQEAEIEVRMSA